MMHKLYCPMRNLMLEPSLIATVESRSDAELFAKTFATVYNCNCIKIDIDNGKENRWTYFSPDGNEHAINSAWHEEEL